ncbi:hypothetical protein AJ79_05681 [Helicocarpus griseus UAMH5409]|uniref:Uncharacterized protein n=1 Tax=Helicocarpus griseus UAMH5409 TaxID=1447875 RepID=A0A2B7XL00_9EURO|nr:hypothetical protein AJ79_05681 [Helicocarpus griseus UAMH5409]
MDLNHIFEEETSAEWATFLYFRDDNKDGLTKSEWDTYYAMIERQLKERWHNFLVRGHRINSAKNCLAFHIESHKKYRKSGEEEIAKEFLKLPEMETSRTTTDEIKLKLKDFDKLILELTEFKEKSRPHDWILVKITWAGRADTQSSCVAGTKYRLVTFQKDFGLSNDRLVELRRQEETSSETTQ